MAYPTVDAPYGLKPVNLIGGQPYAGSTRAIPIASGEGTAIFTGDVVKLAGGVLRLDAGTDAATPIGVFLGCSYTDPTTKQKLFSQYFPAGTVTSDAVGYVADDPNLVFKVAIVSGTTTMSGITAANARGKNGILVQNAGSTATGNSKVALLSTTGTTATFAVRIVDVVEETKNASGSYTEVLVTWNATMHRYNNSTGVA